MLKFRFDRRITLLQNNSNVFPPILHNVNKLRWDNSEILKTAQSCTSLSQTSSLLLRLFGELNTEYALELKRAL